MKHLIILITLPLCGLSQVNIGGIFYIKNESNTQISSIVENNGSLIIENSTLRISKGINNHQTIHVKENSNLQLVDSIITFGSIKNTQNSIIESNGINNFGDIENLDSSIINSGNPIINTGDLRNDGTIKIKGGYKNVGSTEGTGNYLISGDWENNGIQLMAFSTVYFTGGFQNIKGSVTTPFYNLDFVSPDKVTQETVVEIENQLVLNNTEYDCGGNTLYIYNENPQSINYNPLSSGMITTDNQGSVSWYMEKDNTYLIPFGSNLTTSILRPIEIKPFTSQTINSSFHNNQTYFNQNKENRIESINNLYYHSIEANGIIQYGLTHESEEFESLSEYESKWKFNDIKESTPLFLSQRIKRNTYNFIGETKLALTNIKPIVTIIPEFISCNEDGINDSFVIASNDNPKNIKLKVFNRWGSLVYLSNNYQNDWRGEYNGEIKENGKVPSGTYFYEIEVNYDNHENFANKKKLGYVEIRN